MKMAPFISGNEKHPDLVHDDDYRSYLINRVLNRFDDDPYFR
jgi:hypothetical protein